MADQADLIRVVARPGGELAVGRHLPGRGAWLCAGSVSCVQAAMHRKAFARALRVDVTPAAMADLQTTMADRARMEGFESSRPPAG